MQATKNILIINGPNLNMLGIREPEVYGSQTLDEINDLIVEETSNLDVELEFFQTNHEGDIIDEMQAAYFNRIYGIVLNAGAFTHYSYAIRDAIASIPLPVVEVHLSDINTREDFRKKSVIKEVCAATFAGLGYKSYVCGVEWLAEERN